MHGNCCRQKIQNNKKIKFSQKLLDVKEYTNVEDQQTAKQPREPQGGATIMIMNNNNIKGKLV